MRKLILLCWLTCLSANLLAARSLSVGSLPEPVYADAEVSTNVAFTVDYSRLATLHLTLECDAPLGASCEML